MGIGNHAKKELERGQEGAEIAAGVGKEGRYRESDIALKQAMGDLLESVEIVQFFSQFSFSALKRRSNIFKFSQCY